jgi:diguanylate cyclase
MTANEDWRRKYLDTLRELEREDRQHRDRQQALYKLVGRLCLAAQGQSPRLDAALGKLKEAVRRESAPAEMEPLMQEIADAVLEADHGTATLRQIKAVPEQAAAPAALQGIFGEERIRDLLLRLLAEVSEEPKLAAAAEAIRRDLSTALRPESLPEQIERVGGVLAQRLRGLERARQELELLLGQLLGQLDSLTRDVEGYQSDESQRSSSSDALNAQISGEIKAISDSVATGDDLGLIRRQLRSRLDAISRHMLEFRSREEERAQQTRARTEQMRSRMTELEAEASKLRASLTDEKRLSMQDALTKLPNRLAYEQRAAEEFDRWSRFAEPTCMAVWDIDKFKFINDTYGHRAGDKVIAVVAECLAKSIRNTDFVARYGGEEFVMLLPGTTLQDALPLAERIRETLSQMGFHFRGAPVSITISCGITSLQPGDTAANAFERADKALYSAKEGGRNRVVSA